MVDRKQHWKQGVAGWGRARLWVAALAVAAAAPMAAQSANPSISNYFEFGTVVSLGQRTVDIQAFDEKKQRVVQHSFLLGKDARADVVHVGDTVEVIYTPGTDWIVRRLVLITGGIPKAGTPSDAARDVPAAAAVRIAPPPAAAKVPTAVPTASHTAGTGATGGTAASNAAARSVALPTASGGKTAPAANTVDLAKTTAAHAAPTANAVDLAKSNAARGAAASAAVSSIDLGGGAAPKLGTVVEVPLGGGEAANPVAPRMKEVAHDKPAEECNRSSADWPTQPVRLAVLDFRYPTEREESHDIGTTGGGSGTAVADLVFARLEQLNSFAMSRGDRTRLYRADFAGAARVGRELGVDAVLAGTFAPVDPPPGSDPDFPPAKSYELRAGIVDTCTGQLLLRLTSVSCPEGLDPNSSVNAAVCKRFSVTAKQASDPKEMAAAFKTPIDVMLNPLEHSGPPAGTQGTAGVVLGSANGMVTIKLPGFNTLKAGDQVAIHAWRLSKDPSTYTLRNLHDEEIGRVTISGIQAGVATGTYAGDIAPLAGDTAELITP